MMKKIGVLVVTYNRKEYLNNLLDGLLHQTATISFILIVDNNSSDGTRDMLLDRGIITGGDAPKIVTGNVISGIQFYYHKLPDNTGGSMTPYSWSLIIFGQWMTMFALIQIVLNDCPFLLTKITCLFSLLEKTTTFTTKQFLSTTCEIRLELTAMLNTFLPFNYKRNR